MREELPATVKVRFCELAPAGLKAPFSETGAFAVKVVLFPKVVFPLNASEPSPATVALPFRTRLFAKV